MAVKPAPCSESTLTDRYQTTIPEPIRKALGLNKRDKIRYTIQPPDNWDDLLKEVTRETNRLEKAANIEI